MKNLYLSPILILLLTGVSGCSHSLLGQRGPGPSHSELEQATARTLSCPPLIVAHRGASGLYPEHTLEGYKRAIEMGADFIEPDLVSTKDGVLIVRHENEISTTTDVAEKFPSRKRRINLEGKSVDGWFTQDFTLKEIKTLRAKQRLAFRDQTMNGQFEIPTFEEVLELLRKNRSSNGKKIGIYPETKHPSFHQSVHLPLEDKMLSLLKKFGYDTRPEEVFIQSFEISNLKEIHLKAPIYNLTQLLDDPDLKPADQKELNYLAMTQDTHLSEIAKYAYAIAPHKAYVQPVNDSELLAPTNLVQRAHLRGLRVHVYTMRSDKEYMNVAYGGIPEKEYRRFFQLGVDGLFSDFADAGMTARDKYFQEYPCLANP